MPCATFLCAILGNFYQITNALVGILATLALVVFFWGIVKYIASAGDEDKAKEGKSIMIYGVIALFVMFSVFGLITFLRYEFLIGDVQTQKPPRVQF